MLTERTQDWRIWLEHDGHPISYWHDIPLYPNEDDKSIIHYYTEIPRWTDGKIETNRDEPLSMRSPIPVNMHHSRHQQIHMVPNLTRYSIDPIFHDSNKKGLKWVFSVWPHKTYPFNYGSIPQTWEDPNHDHEFTGFPGDNDPVDLFEISTIEYAVMTCIFRFHSSSR